MSLYEKIVSKQEKLALVGLGYVGMPIAVAFAKKVNVIGFDLNSEKINLYKQGIDPTKRLEMKPLKQPLSTLQTTKGDFRRQSLSSWLFLRL